MTSTRQFPPGLYSPQISKQHEACPRDAFSKLVALNGLLQLGCQDCCTFALLHIPDRRGRGATGLVCGSSAADSSTSSTAKFGLTRAVAAARTNQRERCAFITGNRDIGRLRSPRSEVLAANPEKYGSELPGAALIATLLPETKVHPGLSANNGGEICEHLLWY
jgi:hypothetical protein